MLDLEEQADICLNRKVITKQLHIRLKFASVLCMLVSSYEEEQLV
jgi:hypothetical protein